MTAGKTFIISIAGPSCAGKTETSKAVAHLLNARILSLDSYYRDLDHLPFKERTKLNFDDPALLDHDFLFEQLRQLASGKTIHAPTYDFAQYTRAAETETIEPAPYLIVEGLFLLYWEDVRNLSDLTVYVDAPDELCLERRKFRDVRDRGRMLEYVMKQYRDGVRPMAAKYVWPTKRYADLVISGTDSLDHCAAQVTEEVEKRSASIASTSVA